MEFYLLFVISIVFVFFLTICAVVMQRRVLRKMLKEQPPIRPIIVNGPVQVALPFIEEESPQDPIPPSYESPIIR